MPYRIPSDDEVVAALRDVFSNFERIDSQHRLQDLVKRVLDEGNDRPAHVGAERIRHLIVENGIAEVRAHTRIGDDDGLKRCPVCGGEVREVKNQTLFGGEVMLEVRCEECGYLAGRRKCVPARYIFVSKNEK